MEDEIIIFDQSRLSLSRNPGGTTTFETDAMPPNTKYKLIQMLSLLQTVQLREIVL